MPRRAKTPTNPVDPLGTASQPLAAKGIYRMKRSSTLLTLLMTAGSTLSLVGCASQPRPVATMRSVQPPVDDQGRAMGPMPLAVGDSVGQAVFMSRPALVARGLVPSEAAFADGSMSDEALPEE